MADREETGTLAGVERRVADVLREAVPVRAAWRDALMARVAASAARPRRLWHVRPWVAMAAAVGFAAVGAGAALLGARAVLSTNDGPRASASAAMVRFVFVAPGASAVSLVGDFDGWRPHDRPLRRLASGTWIVDVPLTPGRYAYAFDVDGKLLPDPAAPSATDADFGVPNSVVVVRGL